MTERGWVELGVRVRRERVNLKLTQAQFATRLGLKPRTISNIERGAKQNYDPATIDAIEIAMRWAVGSVDRVVNGQEPIPEREAEDELMQRMREAWSAMSLDARDALVRIAELLARPRLPD